MKQSLQEIPHNYTPRHAEGSSGRAKSHRSEPNFFGSVQFSVSSV